MYRISDTVNNNNQPCGCYYYFAKKVNAVRAFSDMGASIIKMPYCADTSKSDDWYTGE